MGVATDIQPSTWLPKSKPSGIAASVCCAAAPLGNAFLLRKPTFFKTFNPMKTIISSIFALALVAGVFILQCAEDIRRQRLAKTGDES